MDVYLVEQPLWKLLETLGAHEALLMVKLSITVDNLLSRSEAALASLAGCTGQGIGNAVARNNNTYIRSAKSPDVQGWQITAVQV